MKHLKFVGLCGACLSLLAAVSSCDNFMGIDDDQSDCGKDFNLSYRMRLLTNKDIEEATVFNSANDQYVAKAVDDALSKYFREYADNLDLSFYRDQTGAVELSESQPINGNQAAYTFYLEHDIYDHLAVGNSDQETAVALAATDQFSTARLTANGTTTLQNHHVALYTGRARLDATGQKALDGQVDLYMANSAAVLVIDTTGYEVRDIQMTVEGVASAFNIADSTYTYNGGTIDAMRLDMSAYPDNKREALYTYCFPSRDQATKADEAIWTIKVYVTLTDGTITENVLSIYEPLKAGNVEIYKSKIDEKGVLLIADSQVGVSVTLDWKPGGQYNPDL